MQEQGGIDDVVAARQRRAKDIELEKARIAAQPGCAAACVIYGDGTHIAAIDCELGSIGTGEASQSDSDVAPSAGDVEDAQRLAVTGRCQATDLMPEPMRRPGQHVDSRQSFERFFVIASVQVPGIHDLGNHDSATEIEVPS
jgi:hypothetical protein